MTNFYALKSKCQAWSQDLRWLNRSWDPLALDVDATLDLFALEAHGLGDTRIERDKACAKQVVHKYSTSAFCATYRLPSGSAWITFSEVVGCVARDYLMNDSSLHMALQAVCDLHRGCWLFSSHFCNLRWPITPRTPCGEVIDVMKMRFLILPINVSSIHWALIVVKVQHGRITPYFYDSVSMSKVHVEAEWEKGMLPFLRKWEADYASETGIAGQPKTIDQPAWLKDPKQRDKTSCGELIVVQAYALVNDSSRFS